jgi:hypothetical protein
LFLNIFESGDGVEHAGVGHARPLESLHLLTLSPHIPEITGDGLCQSLLALLIDLPQLLFVLIDLLFVEAAVELKLVILFPKQEDLFMGR